MTEEDETIDQRNSLREYRHYTIEEQFVPLTEAELELANKRRKELQAKYESAEKINLWEFLQ